MKRYRLSQKEEQAIVRCCKEHDADAIVYLYGSRADLSARGGDIDLLVVSETLRFQDKLSILANLKDLLGDQKIDLTILSHTKFSRDPFAQSVTRVELTGS